MVDEFNGMNRLILSGKADVRDVEKDGLSYSDIVGEKIKLANIFRAYDLNNDLMLDSKELALAMDSLEGYDFDGDGNISQNELKDVVENYNNAFGLQNTENALSVNDIENFFKNIDKLSSGLEISPIPDDTPSLDIDEFKIDLDNYRKIDIADRKLTPTTQITLYDHTVQDGQRLNDLMKDVVVWQKQQQREEEMALEGKSYIPEDFSADNVTDEELKKALEDFKNDNPGVVKKT